MFGTEGTEGICIEDRGPFEEERKYEDIGGSHKVCSEKPEPVSTRPSEMRVIACEWSLLRKNPASLSDSLRAKFALVPEWANQPTDERNKKALKHERNTVIQINLYIIRTPAKRAKKVPGENLGDADGYPAREVWLGNKHNIYPPSGPCVGVG